MKTMENPPKTSLIQLTIDGSCARIELAREDKFNALNVDMITELIEIFEWTKERSAGLTMHWKTSMVNPIFAHLFFQVEVSTFALELTST